MTTVQIISSNSHRGTTNAENERKSRSIRRRTRNSSCSNRSRSSPANNRRAVMVNEGTSFNAREMVQNEGNL